MVMQNFDSVSKINADLLHQAYSLFQMDNSRPCKSHGADWTREGQSSKSGWGSAGPRLAFCLLGSFPFLSYGPGLLFLIKK